MAKSSQKHSEKRWKQGRLSVRIHDDLRDALEFLAERDHRPLSNYVEQFVIGFVREQLINSISEYGERMDNEPWMRRIDIAAAQVRAGPHSGMRGFPPKRK
jgi:hypothetical protein